MSDYMQVTFIGGPLDLTRRAVPVGDTQFRCYLTDNSPWELDRVQRGTGVKEIRAEVVTYYFRAIGYNERGRPVMVGTLGTST